MEARDRLLEAALRVFEEGGSRGATTRRIAAEAGVNEVTLFRLFGSKAALLSAALHASMRRAPDGVLPPTPVRPEAELLTWVSERMRTLLDRRDVMRAAMAEMAQCPDMAGPVTTGPVQTARELTAYIRQMQSSGMADPAVDASAAAAMLMGAMFTDVMTRDMMPERFEYAQEDAPALFVGLLLRALSAAGPSHQPGGRGAGPRPVKATEERQPS
jgi:AcrR family transcriptional regulator